LKKKIREIFSRYIKPQEIPAEGGTVIIGLRRQIPEQFWNQVQILLVNLAPEWAFRNSEEFSREFHKNLIESEYISDN
jgi:hypothetical protein